MEPASPKQDFLEPDITQATSMELEATQPPPSTPLQPPAASQFHTYYETYRNPKVKRGQPPTALDGMGVLMKRWAKEEPGCIVPFEQITIRCK